MVIKNSRAQRRHDIARLKKKRHGHWGYGKQGWRRHSHNEFVKMSPSVAGMVVNTPTPCSCYMCGNPRRNSWAESPLTMQERKAESSYADGLDEYDECNYTYWWEYYDDYSDYGDDLADDWYLRWMYIND